jgi:hypothetical protein
MKDLISLNREATFYIDLHNQKHTVGRPWAILEVTKYGPKQFDVYLSKEHAENAAKLYGISISEKPKE